MKSRNINKKKKRINLALLLVLLLSQGQVLKATAIEKVELPGMTIHLDNAMQTNQGTGVLEMIAVITIIALAPSILILMTSFLRIIISLHFIRSAVGTTTVPPNQVLVGIALFLTFYVMSPVFTQINKVAIQPYEKGSITQEQAIEEGLIPLKDFMLRQTRDEDISLFMEIAGRPMFESADNIVEEMPLHILIPAFIISELRAGFLIGFLVYIPFIVIDMIVASTLMSMGMMMLPPAMISLPFKVLLFILVDGWHLLIGQLIQTFK